MGRLRRHVKPARRTMLGSLYQEAYNAVYRMRSDTVRTMTTFPKSANELVQELWPEDVLHNCKMGRRDSDETIAHAGGMLGAYNLTNGVTVSIDFRDTVTTYLPPKANRMNDFQPVWLMDHLAEVKNIIRDFACVSHVLAWMDENATAGAVCHYWPAMRTLAPSFEWGLFEGANFREPGGLHAVMPLLRSTSTTVAAAAFLKKQPDTAERLGLTFNFSEGTFIREVGLANIEVQSPEWNYCV